MDRLIYFAHSGADHGHGITSHSHWGPATIFWLAIITLAVVALLFAVVIRLSKSSKLQVQEQEKKERQNG